MSNNLFSKVKENYGNEYEKHFFEQYKLYVESAEKISDRRQHANNYFITINTALITFLGLSFQVNFLSSPAPWLVRLLIVFVGIIICFIFRRLLCSYKQLNAGKFKVIHEIEENLPLALYSYEWKFLKEGKEKKIYYPFSHTEILIPRVFCIIYVILFIIVFIN